MSLITRQKPATHRLVGDMTDDTNHSNDQGQTQQAPVPPAPQDLMASESPAKAASAGKGQKAATGQKRKTGAKTTSQARTSGQNRQSRAADTREAGERMTEWQPPHQRAQLSHPQGFRLRWLRTSYNGQDDFNNMESKLSEGYQLVRPDDPIVAEKVQRGELHESNGRVQRGGLVLAKIPEEFARQRNAHYTREAELHQQSVDDTLKRNQTPSMPITIDSNRQ